MNNKYKYLNEKKKYKIQTKGISGKWMDENPKGKYSKTDAELIVKKAIENGRNKNSIRIVKEDIDDDKLDVLDKLEIETLIRETKEYLDDEELCEKAIAAAGWGKKSVEKFGETIGKSPSEEGFFDVCSMRMKGKKGWDKEKANGFCARLIDTYKGSTAWRSKNN